MAESSQKRVLIDKANQSMFVMIASVAALVVFSGVSTRSLLKQSSHRAKVITAKKIAANTLAANDSEIGKLIDSYKVFESSPESVIRTTDKNSKIILDALPPKYDFPALASSLEKILTDGGYGITGISGTDNELSITDTLTPNPAPIEMPFTLSVSGNYDKVKGLLGDLERSIRPIYVSSVSLSGTETDAKLNVVAKTYYQPGKNLSITKKAIK
jgi:hypothetical protein